MTTTTTTTTSTTTTTTTTTPTPHNHHDHYYYYHHDDDSGEKTVHGELIYLGGTCGTRGQLLGNNGVVNMVGSDSLANACAALAEGAKAKAFSVGKNAKANR